MPVIAFHSYKGGVGRTLSLTALAKGIAKRYGDQKKVLIIDSDLEAPGLTWMINGSQENAAVSYLDVLSLMHFHDINAELAEKIAGLIRKSSLTIETEKLETEHYFLPVYRETEQLLDIFSSPEKIIANQNNKYIISEFLSMIGGSDRIFRAVSVRPAGAEIFCDFNLHAVDKRYTDAAERNSAKNIGESVGVQNFADYDSA